MPATANAYQAPAAQLDVALPNGPVTDRTEILGVFPAVRNGAIALDVYIDANRLVAAKTGGQMAANGMQVVMHQFGLLGALISYFLKKQAQKKVAAAREERRALSLDELLRTDPKNFEIKFATMESVHLKKPGFMDHLRISGQYVGMLVIAHGHPKPTILTLANKADLGLCRTTMEKGIGTRLTVDPKLKF